MCDLIMIPGLGSDAAVWSRTIDALGGSISCTVADTLSDRSLADMARRILDAAPERFVLAGLSMGGMVALEIMRLDAGRVAGLAIVNSEAFPDTREQAEQRRRTLAALRGGIDLQAAGRAGLARLVHREALSEIGDAIVAMGIRVGAAAYARQVQAVLDRPDQRPILRTINVPTLVVTGADDIMIPPARAKALADAIRDAELAIIPKCGHLPPIEQPRAMAKHLRRLLDRAGGAA